MSIFDTIKNAIPHAAMDMFIRSTDVASYVPGRVRLYSKQLVNNASLEKQVHERLNALVEIERVDTNIATGSILITYEPERCVQTRSCAAWRTICALMRGGGHHDVSVRTDARRITGQYGASDDPRYRGSPC